MTTENTLELQELPVTSRSLGVVNDFVVDDNLEAVTSFIDSPECTSQHMTRRPFKIKFNSVIICYRGLMKVRINLSERVVRRGQMIIIPADTIGEFIEMSPDCRMMMFSFSKHLRVNFNSFIRPSVGIITAMMRLPVVDLEDRELEDIKYIYMMMRRRLVEDTFLNKTEFFMSALMTISHYIAGTRLSDSDNEETLTTNTRRIFERFIELVEQHHGSERQLTFYAQKLCISPKYLSHVVKEVSGRTAKQWIDNMVILEAKVLLTTSHMNIQEISHRLNFPNQSFFGRFFKKANGVSPGDYRQR